MMRTCPKCKSSKITSCRCMRGDSTCQSCGHEWHTCTVHNVQVEGKFDHSVDINTSSCTCLAKDYNVYSAEQLKSITKNFKGDTIKSWMELLPCSIEQLHSLAVTLEMVDKLIQKRINEVESAKRMDTNVRIVYPKIDYHKFVVDAMEGNDE